MSRAVGETVAGYVGGSWSGIGAPGNTPIEIIDLLNREVNATLKEPKIKEQIENMGSPDCLADNPQEEFRQLIAVETERWAKVVQFANIKPE